MKNGLIVNDRGNFWYLNDKLHREGNLPACEWTNGTKEYYINNKLHREDGPAIEWHDGWKAYYVNGQRHREDGPAIEGGDGSKSYFLNDIFITEKDYWKEIERRKIIPIKKEFDDRIEYRLLNGDLHREDGPAIQWLGAGGGKQWWIHGKLHREGNPAVEWENGAYWWYNHGKLHREDGPAIIFPSTDLYGETKFWYKNNKPHREDGPAIEYSDGHKSYYLNGEIYSEEDYWKEIERRKMFPIIKKEFNDRIEYRLPNGLLHREDGPAIEWPGHKEWYLNGMLHREGNLPACEYSDGTKLWFINGKCHREGTLPACEYAGGYKEWWIDGKFVARSRRPLEKTIHLKDIFSNIKKDLNHKELSKNLLKKKRFKKQMLFCSLIYLAQRTNNKSENDKKVAINQLEEEKESSKLPDRIINN